MGKRKRGKRIRAKGMDMQSRDRTRGGCAERAGPAVVGGRPGGRTGGRVVTGTRATVGEGDMRGGDRDRTQG